MKVTRKFALRSRQIVTVRLPQGCHVSSDGVRRIMQAYLRYPGKLPADPGAGGERVSLSLPRQELALLVSILRDSESSSLRRLIAWGVDLSPIKQRRKSQVKVPTLEEVLGPYRKQLAQPQRSCGGVSGALVGAQEWTGQSRPALSGDQIVKARLAGKVVYTVPEGSRQLWGRSLR